MKRQQFSEAQVIGILKEAEAGAVVTDLCRRQGMSSATSYAWKENSRLKRLLADTMLDNAGLKDLLSKNGEARCEAGSGRASPDGAGDERSAGVCCRRSGSHEHAVSFVPGG